MKIAFLRQVFLPFASRFLCGLLLVLCGSGVLAQTPLSLPFFEDFSTATGRPGIDVADPARWRGGSGVYINNTMSINHPTINVASFDGLKQNGRPYQINNPLAQDYTDTLESLPINLSGLTADSKVYLSFYWQIRGLGELPDAGDSLSRLPADSLTLQFLDNGGIWRTVWAKAGGTINNNFLQEFVAVDRSIFLHANFAFRFRSFGRSSGPFDTWNIDYIYVNKGRSLNDIYVKDVATRQPLTSFFKRYMAMPLSQYNVNPVAETADTVTTDINNLFNGFNVIGVGLLVRDEVSGRVIQDYKEDGLILGQLSSLRKSIKATPATNLGSATRALLRYKVTLGTTDNQNPSIPEVDLRRNDTISSVAVLDDYYAYDDGTWEYAQQIRQREQIAVRFILNKPDAIGGVRACIVPFTTNQTGQSFVIKVFSNNGGRPGTAIYQQAFTTQYPNTRNGFVDFKFTKSVSVKDTFYVGYQQISSTDTTLLRIGFDKNSPFGAHIFYNGGTNWEQNLASSSLNVPGAFMLRPVMGARPDSIVTATPEPLAPLYTYPNPTAGLLRWDNQTLNRLEIMNSSGRTVLAVEPGRGQQTLDVSHLPDGLYLVRLFADQRTAVQKIIIQH
ncbi:hypothetical protein GCM10028807_27230 [Spirosoma daeguense]